MFYGIEIETERRGSKILEVDFRDLGDILHFGNAEYEKEVPQVAA